MKIAILDFNANTVDLITVDDNWIDNDLREELPEWYDDEEWHTKSKDDKIEHFIFEYCGYSADNIQYMVDYEKVEVLTPKDFN